MLEELLKVRRGYASGMICYVDFCLHSRKKSTTTRGQQREAIGRCVCVCVSEGGVIRFIRIVVKTGKISVLSKD